jgi:hypothetical protein
MNRGRKCSVVSCPLDHAASDTIYRLSPFEDGHVEVNASLEDGQLMAVQAKAHVADFDEPVHMNGERLVLLC